MPFIARTGTSELLPSTVERRPASAGRRRPRHRVSARLRDRPPAAAARTGPWALGPMFADSELIKADADLIAAGCCWSGPASGGRVHAPGLRRRLSHRRVGPLHCPVRLGYLATWELGALLSERAGYEISVQSARGESSGLSVRMRGCGMSRAGTLLPCGATSEWGRTV
jgi:hypothetical protein